jgi:hypothetical protein
LSVMGSSCNSIPPLPPFLPADLLGSCPFGGATRVPGKRDRSEGTVSNSRQEPISWIIAFGTGRPIGWQRSPGPPVRTRHPWGPFPCVPTALDEQGQNQPEGVAHRLPE